MSGILTFILMLILWVLLSGKFDTFHLTLGVVSSVIVAKLSSDLLFQNKKSLTGRLTEGGRFISYTIWLLAQITTANMHVIYLALSTKSMEEIINPYIFTFKTSLQTDFARFVLANSITLTPGTVTIRIENDTFYVHAINEKAAGDLANSESISIMEKKIAMVFEPENIQAQLS